MDESVLLITIRHQGENERKSFVRDSEIRSLIETLGLRIIYTIGLTVKEISGSTYIGRGQTETVLEAVRAFSPDEVIIDASISPRQESNLERIFSAPVSDREAVILSIFFQNARSREAKLQIEKAECEYLRPRLADREANLSQQRGGVRGAKGEGERRIELERRRIDERIRALDKEIKETGKTRRTQRQRRIRNGIFTFALVGYTNAGKSTILNSLTDAGVEAEDKLFATLDTTTRAMRLPNGQRVLISDTVGFISELPASLVRAFASTLEEALSADALIIVADASHPDAKGSLEETERTLKALGALDKARILVLNKIDDIYDDIAHALMKSGDYITVETSMKENIGIDELLSAMCMVTDNEFTTLTLHFPQSNLPIGELGEYGDIINIGYTDTEAAVTVRMRKSIAERYAMYIEDRY